jgi:hypothetical protein
MSTAAARKIDLGFYESSEGIKIYNAAVAALSTKYTENTVDINIFLKNVKERG